MKRRFKNKLIGLAGILACSFTGCRTIETDSNFIDKFPKPPNPYKEIFNPDTPKPVPPINVDYQQHDESHKTKIIGDRAYAIDEPSPVLPLEEIVDVIPTTKYKIPLINASYIKYQRIITETPEQNSETTGNVELQIIPLEPTQRIASEILLHYPCRIASTELKKTIEPFIQKEIEMFEFAEANMISFRGEEKAFGDFSYICSILNKYDVIPKQVRFKTSVVEIFDDVTYDKEHKLSIYDKNKKLILSLNLPSSPDGRDLEFGIGFSPLYGLEKKYYDFDSLIKLLESTGRVEVRHEVDLQMTNGKPSEMRNVTLIPFSERILSKDALINTIAYKEAGPSLKVTPHCDEQGFITLEFNPPGKDEIGMRFSEHTGFAGTEQLPTLKESDYKSQVTVRNGYTYVGMIASASRYVRVERGIPFVRKLPFIGPLTTSISLEKNASNLVYLLEARVIPRESLTGIIQRE